MSKKEYVVTKNGKEKFKGSDWECYKFILDNQPHSTYHAFKNGWNFKEVKKEIRDIRK
jgi:hypothetical protein